MNENEIIQWLLQGDVSIQYQVHRDLFQSYKNQLRERIAQEGWGFHFLSLRKDNGYWGRAFYQPKWTSTHYTLLDLKHLGLPPTNEAVKETLSMLINNFISKDGGINPSPTIADSDVCINGMFLNYAAYFRTNENDIKSIVDFILLQHMKDGGFNCQFNRIGAVHSSLHSTLSVIEGIREYSNNGYTYRVLELVQAELAAREFILQHRLFRSHRTGEIIDKKMLMLSYPSRWRYDILRALDYFQWANVDFDPRMQDAVQLLLKKRRSDHRWPLQNRHKGETHFEMEITQHPSRWNTLRALRVLKHFGINKNPDMP